MEPKVERDKSIDMLEKLFEMQYKMQTEAMHYNFVEMSEQERGAFVKDHVLYCEDELHEVLREIPFFKAWKRYSKYPEENGYKWAAARKEFVDALHFFLNVAIALGFTAEELFEMYCIKNNINYERQKDQSSYKPCADEA